MSGFELTVVVQGTVVHAVPVTTSPLRIGRAPASDLVLEDESVSWHHAQVWIEGERGWVQDLASRNGSFVNDKRIRGATPLEAGAVLRVGNKVTLQLRGGRMEDAVPMLLLVDLDAGVRFPLRSDRFHLGSASDAHLRLPEGPARAATIGVLGDGTVWISTDDETQEALPMDRPFEVAGRRMQIIRGTASHAPTVEYGAHRYPYDAVANGDGPSGPEVVLSDSMQGTTKLFTRNRGLLLYLLARQLHEDRLQGASVDTEGWCNDNDVAVGIWGKSAADANKLHVLIHRLRKAVKEAGFDPWFIEKRQWGVRVRLRRVTLRDS